MRNLINAEHIGSNATDEEARDLVGKLKARGFDVGFGIGGSWRFESDEARRDFENAFDEELGQIPRGDL